MSPILGFVLTVHENFYNNVSLSGFRSRRDEIIVENDDSCPANPEWVTLF